MNKSLIPNCPECECHMFKRNLERYGMCFSCYMKKEIKERKK